jgi:hypothetical protein
LANHGEVTVAPGIDWSAGDPPRGHSRLNKKAGAHRSGFEFLNFPRAQLPYFTPQP